MTNILFASSVLLGMLCAPALADGPTMYRIDVSLRADGPAHEEVLFVSDNTCGKVSAKSSARESYLRVCAMPVDQKRVRLEIERRVRDSSDERHAESVLVVAPGGTYDVLDAKLTIKAQ